MSALAAETPRPLARIFSRRRLLFTLGAATVFWLFLSLPWESSRAALLLRVLVIAFVSLTAFGLFEVWPRRLPRWLARWALQVFAATVVIPFTVAFIYSASTAPGAPPFWKEEKRITGFAMMTLSGILFVPWIAVAAVIRKRDAEAHAQALRFERERGQLERQALDARHKLLQAQVQPHFLFNTLANVRQLVETRSPQAPAVLDSLIAYLRAAVPRIDEAATTVGDEVALARAYLALMQLRMPDRLTYDIVADDAALRLRCPPMTLLTLVENAIRHGIDPAEQGGRIDVRVDRLEARCRLRVADTGVGLRAGGGAGLGTGLASLRERLALAFSGAASLKVEEGANGGVIADIEIPAEAAA